MTEPHDTSRPRVSVIIPTYNREHSLGRAIQSVLDQTYGDLELIVVDDASTDETEGLVKSFQDSRVRYLRHGENRGGGGARNTGISAARGQLISFLDSDDEWLPTKLARQVSVFDRGSTTLGLVYVEIVAVTPEGSFRQRSSRKRGRIFRDQIISDQLPPTSAVMVHARCFQECGVFDERLPARQDYDMWLRLCSRFEVDFVDEALVRFYSGGSDRISRSPERVVAGSLMVLEKVMAMIASEPEPFQRMVMARHYSDLGRRVAGIGCTDKAVPYLLRSLRLSFSPSTALCLGLCLLGNRGWLIGAQTRRRVRALLHLLQGRLQVE
jgi:glycosyltransferase involved in cell wall biosynthesis